MTLAIVIWPAAEPSLIAPLLQAAGFALEADPARADRVVVEDESLPLAAVAGFDAAVAEGRAEDSAAGFLQFASLCHDDLADFRARWPAGPGRLVLSRAALRADPGPWLRRLADFVLPPAAGPADLDRLSRAAEALFAARPAPDVARFRHHDAATFDRIGKFALRRAEVEQIFAEVMGRRIDGQAIPHFQGVASREALREALLASPEHQRRKRKDERSSRPDGPHSPVLVHLHVPKSAGTSLNSILAANFGPGEKISLSARTADRLSQMPAPQRANLRLVFGHMPHGMVAQILGQTVQHVVVLRQPGPRLLSYYRYLKRQSEHPMYSVLNERSMSFGDFLEYCVGHPGQRPEVDNGQMRRVAGQILPAGLGREPEIFRAALRNIFAPDMVFGLTERFGALLDSLVARGLIRGYEPITANAAPETASFEKERASLTTRQLALLSDFTAWDQKLYNICETYLFGLEPQTGD